MNERIHVAILAGVIGCLLAGCGGGDASDDAQAQPLSADPERATIQSLSTSKPPGENFNLSSFSLQLPTGSKDNPDTVSSSELATFKDSPYFYTNSSDGAMVMADPERGWTTSGSLHPRVELRENATWTTGGTNTLSATVKIVKVPDHTTIGQIFQGSGPSKPLCELQVTSDGTVQLLLEQTNEGEDAGTHDITKVSIDAKFDYELELSGSTITAKANGTTKTYALPSSFHGERFYFKAGDYDQTATEGEPLTSVGTIVHFYTLTIKH